MNRGIGTYITCTLFGLLLLLLLPLVLILLLVLGVIQMITGRKLFYMSRFRPMGRRREPEEDPAAEEDVEIRASEAIIDAEIVDLPDEPPAQLDGMSDTEKP